MNFIVKGTGSYENTPFEEVEHICQDYYVVKGPAERDDLLKSYPWVEYAEVEETGTAFKGSSALR